MSLDEASTNDSTLIDDDLVASLGFEPTTVIEPIPDVVDVRDEAIVPPAPDHDIAVSSLTDAPSSEAEVVELPEEAIAASDLASLDAEAPEIEAPEIEAPEVEAPEIEAAAPDLEFDDPTPIDASFDESDESDESDEGLLENATASAAHIELDDESLTDDDDVVAYDELDLDLDLAEVGADDVIVDDADAFADADVADADADAEDDDDDDDDDNDDGPLFGSGDSVVLLPDDVDEPTGDVKLFDIGGDDELGDSNTIDLDAEGADTDLDGDLDVPLGLDLVDTSTTPKPAVDPSSLATLDEVFAAPDVVETPTITDVPTIDDERTGAVATAAAAPVAQSATARAVTPAPDSRHRKLRARKVRRVIRHIDPWSVLTFSVLFHLVFFSSMLLASILVWNGAVQAGTIDNIENFIRELGDYETFNINSDVVFRAAVVIAGMLTLASSIVVVLLAVVFNLVSDLVGGIRITVVEEDTVVVPPTE